MKLVIFPGGGSPDNDHYRKVYKLLQERGNEYGYSCVEVLRWPGHADETGCDPGSRLTLDGALESANNKLDELESACEPYRVLGRSFGTLVAAQVATTRDLKAVNRFVLWGAFPYWIGWKLCKKQLGDMLEKFKSRGMYIDETYFDSLVPIEAILGEIRYETLFATGTEDPYSPPYYLAYLKLLVGASSRISFCAPVIGAPHEVTADADSAVVAAYCQAVLA